MSVEGDTAKASRTSRNKSGSCADHYTTCSHSRGAANEKTYLTTKFLLLVKVPVVVVTTTGPVVAPLGTTTVR